MVAVCCKVEADWHEDEIMGLNLFEMNEKRFNLTYCGPRADTGRRYLSPMPTCYDVQKTQVQRSEPIKVTFWSQKVNNITFNAISCRAAFQANITLVIN